MIYLIQVSGLFADILYSFSEFTGSCAGNCSYTCSGDGRKYDSVAGLGGRRATCLDDNYMCTDSDPYLHRDNILVHELAHTIHQYGLSYDNNNKVCQTCVGYSTSNMFRGHAPSAFIDIVIYCYPSNKRHWSNVGLILAQSPRR